MTLYKDGSSPLTIFNVLRLVQPFQNSGNFCVLSLKVQSKVSYYFQYMLVHSVMSLVETLLLSFTLHLSMTFISSDISFLRKIKQLLR